MSIFRKLWLKIFPLEIVEMNIGGNLIKLRGRKNKWTHYAISVSWWQNGQDKMADFAIWKDGETAIRYMLEEDGTVWTPKKRKNKLNGQASL